MVLTKPLIQLRAGDVVRNRYFLDSRKTRQWKYAGECADVGGGLMEQSSLTIAEIHRAHPMWVKLAVPGRSPPAFLKLSAEELVLNFDN